MENKIIIPPQIHNESGLENQMLLTVKEVAVILKTNVSYVHKLRKAGHLPFLKIGQYKIRKEALENFLRLNEGKDLTNPFNVKELIEDGKD